MNRSLDVLRLSVDNKQNKNRYNGWLGETFNEVVDTMKQVSQIGVKLFTIGQYLQPTKNHLPVARFVDDKEFLDYEHIGIEMGFDIVKSGSLVRSSYHADEFI